MFLLINHIIHNEPLIAYSLSALKRTAEVMNVNASGKKQQKYLHNIIIHYYDSSSPQWTRMFHTDYIIWKYLIYIWIGSFKSRHFTFYRYSIFFMSLRQALSFGSFHFFFEALKFTKTAESASCLLSLFYKITMICCYCEGTQKKVDILQIWKMYYSYLWQKWSIWANDYSGHPS